MTILAIVLVALVFILSFALGAVCKVSNQRWHRCEKKSDEIKKLTRKLDCISGDINAIRIYELEEDDVAEAYNILLKVYVRQPYDLLASPCYCLIKQFNFDYDKEFALSQAEELLDKLNE